MLRKWIPAFICLAHWLVLTPGNAVSQDEFWQDSVAIARQKAAATNRMLIVVQFDVDFLKPVDDIDEIKNYQQHGLSEDARQWIQQNAVIVAQNVGHPANLQLAPQKTKHAVVVNQPVANPAKSIANCVTWFCNPQGIVFGFHIGYPDTDGMNARLESLYAGFQLLGDSPEPTDVRQWHLSQVQQPDQALFLKFARPPKLKASAADRQQRIDRLSQAAATARRARMTERFGKRLHPRMLGLFGALENQFFSMMLAEIPDADFAEWQRPVWQHLAGSRMWNTDQEAVIAWVEEQRNKKLAILLRFPDLKDSKSKWPPPSRSRLKDLLGEFAYNENAKIDDMAVIANYFQTAPLAASAEERPTFFVSTSLGDQYQLFTDQQDDRDLTKKMEVINELEIQRR